MSIREKLQARLDKIKKEREAENNIRNAVRQEEMAKEEERRKAARLEKITKQEEQRAKEGGFLTRSAKSLVKKGLAEGRKEFGKKPRKHRSKRRKAKAKKRTVRHRTRVHRRVTEYY